jgi:catechol 2,3-dioxygenase-like lactoylglutathione lyase family enzyme
MGGTASREGVNRFGMRQSSVRLDRQNPYLRINAVNVFVKDQERSLQFYVNQLGFDLAVDSRLPSGHRLIAVAPPDGTTVLRLIAPDPGSEDYKLIGRPTPIVFLTEDVVAKFREWRKRGVHFVYTPRLRRIKRDPLTPSADQQPVWGGTFTRFEDVDRNSFALVGFDEVSQALEEQRRVIAEKLEFERRAEQELEIARRRTTNKLGRRSIKLADTPQPSEQVRQMAAIHAAIVVQLINHHIAQVLKALRPVRAQDS